MSSFLYMLRVLAVFGLNATLIFSLIIIRRRNAVVIEFSRCQLSDFGLEWVCEQC